MKYLLLILLFPSLLEAQSRAVSKDKTVEISTTDTNIILAYIGHSKDTAQWVDGGSGNSSMGGACSGYGYEKNSTKAKYDTIAGWHLVSDTLKGWNPASAIYLYDIRIYVFSRIIDGKVDVLPSPLIVHYKWLDSNKKPFNLKVWATQ